MVSLAAYAASLAALLSAVNAGFYTTYPVGADAVNPGQTISIRWRPDTSAPDLSTVTKYTLKFMTGGNIVQTTVRTIGEFDIATTTIPFTIPQTAPGMYFLMYTASNGVGSSWSTRFSVGGGTTWYPAGVATGVDPGTPNTDIDTPIVITASSSTASSSTAPSSNPITSTSQTSVGSSSSTRTSTTSPAGPNTSTEEGGQSNTGGASSVPSSPNPSPNPQTSTTPIQDTSDPVVPPSNNPGNTDQTTDTNVDNTNTSSTGSSSKDGKSSSESSKSSSDSTSSNNGAAARYLSAAALVVAAAFAW
ncbi:hypothetical protein GGI19_000766 [Coemansia pectinata]|uniref:Ser-Thr-rich glycosyl-phosphatidyl-inositol-anchored membrane family-domain-containing protein n=1 Tax=Coemansia pectinata TaxID=1052879 RepID=A0A9W8H4T9_9FUNG|nr:hypothetical protein GGI19_000766 [Coemansia pectinata]